jgi:dTDP-4-dehydrorhamnose reductase/beta-phosphoglucomutase-like phosphatase (HAD superfamily)
MILICGSSGLVGKELSMYFDNNNIKYIGTYNKNKLDKKNMFYINFSDPYKVEEFLVLNKITCCIFCIVERLLDKCENNWNDIKHTNIDLVHIISYICNKLDINFIHLSTDYVFDGLNQPNLPDSIKNPLQNYGISKLISEYRIIKNCSKYCIIRTPVLYSPLSKIHDNAVCLIGKNIMDLRKNKTFKEDNYCIRRPLYIYDLCCFIHDCVKNEYKGIYHFYNPYNKFTKYDICKIIGNTLCIEINNIIPNNSPNEDIAPRPYDTQLLDTKFNIYDYKFHDFNETINKCFSKFKHPHIKLENKNEIFILLDLDGTIIDSNLAHYNAYINTFKKYSMEFLNYGKWNNYIMNRNIDDYLNDRFNKDIDMVNKIKQDKIEFLKNEEIIFTTNSDIFLEYLIDNNFNFCIVTNTSKKTLDIFKEKLPLLQKIKQWIYRENYKLPKPNKECYELAINKFITNEKYIIGFEDSLIGYNSLKQVTDIIFIYNNDTIFKTNDCFIFDNYNVIIT